MTQTFNISGRGNLVTNILRALFVAAAGIGGFLIFAASAAFAFFVIAGLVILGVIVFAFLWTRAKLLGRPFGPKAQFEAAKRDMEAQMREATGRTAPIGDEGPIIDARQTPEGWSVDG